MTAAPRIERAPAGWGYTPGAALALQPVTTDELPELPFLRFVPKRRQKAVVAKALADLPALPMVTPSMLQARYGIGNTLAGDALDMARLRQW